MYLTSPLLMDVQVVSILYTGESLRNSISPHPAVDTLI